MPTKSTLQRLSVPSSSYSLPTHSFCFSYIFQIHNDSDSEDVLFHEASLASAFFTHCDSPVTCSIAVHSYLQLIHHLHLSTLCLRPPVLISDISRAMYIIDHVVIIQGLLNF